MSKIGLMIKKNFLMLITSKWLALIVILGPLLTIFLAGIAFDNLNTYKMNIGVYSETYNQFTNSFILKLNTDEFRTIKTDSKLECIDNVKMGISHTCIIFPPNLELNAENKEILIYIDYSKLNLAWIVREKLFSRIDERSTEITKELTGNILSKLLIARDEISKDALILVLVKENEASIEDINSKTLDLILNKSGILNSSDVHKLASKTASVKVAMDLAMEKSEKNLRYAENLVRDGDFDDDEKEEYLSDIKQQRSFLREKQNYIDGLYDPDYSGSINRTLENLSLSVEEINNILLISESNLADIDGLSDLNYKLLKRLVFSISNLEKELEDSDKLSAGDIAAPVVAGIKPITSYNSNLNYIFPTLMAISILLAAILLSAIVVVTELNSQAFFRNTISPTSKVSFFFSSYLTNLSLIGIHIFLMLNIAMFFFFSQIIGNFFTILIVSLLIATFFIVLGMGIGHLFKTEQMSILAAASTSSMLLFLSNILMPIENTPEIFSNIVQYNPFIISVSLLRKSILFDQSLLALKGEIFVLVLFTFLLIALYAVICYGKGDGLRKSASS